MNDTTDATAIFAPIWRRKWLILGIAVLVSVGTYFYYKHKPALFKAQTTLYLGAGAEEQVSEKAVRRSSLTDTNAQATLINSIVVEQAKKKLRKEHGHVAKAAGRGKAKAKSAEKSSFLTISAEVHGAKSAALLANTVAEMYIRRQRNIYLRGLDQEIAIARRQLRAVETPRVTPVTKSATGKTKGGTLNTASVLQTASLNQKINQLEAQRSIKGVQQVKVAQAKTAELISPLPKKNAEFGFVVGLVLASIAAFALSRFNRRLRTLADMEAVLQTQVLTALPKVRSPIVQRGGEIRPSKQLLEPLRRLHTTLVLGGTFTGANRAAPRSLLFLSADSGDGRSTVVADLALLQREAGQRVAVIEADFRHPVQARLFGLAGHRGLVDVLTGAASAEEATQTVSALEAQPVGQHVPAGGVATALAPGNLGSVSVLTGSTAAANPPLLLASPTMTELLRGASEDYDSVLIDVPASLAFSDVIPLLSVADGIVLVARAGHTREQFARRLQQMLAQTPSTPVLGVVANAVSPQDMKRYGIAGGSGQGWLARLTRR